MTRYAYGLLTLLVALTPACGDRTAPAEEDSTPGVVDLGVDGAVFPGVDAEISAPDTGELGADSMLPADDSSAGAPGAYLLWQAPGGFVGQGPALELLADGTVRLWGSTTTLTPHQTADWDQQLQLTASQLSALSALLQEIDLTALPHSNEEAGECYPMLHLEACAGCPAQTLSDYGSATNLKPELDAVYQWLTDELSAEMAIELPPTYCTYTLGRIPCGNKTCDGNQELCVIRVAWTKTYSCEAVPESCRDDLTCDCLDQLICQDGYDACYDGPSLGDGVIRCDCPAC